MVLKGIGLETWPGKNDELRRNFCRSGLLIRVLMERSRPSTASPVTLDGGPLHQYSPGSLATGFP